MALVVSVPDTVAVGVFERVVVAVDSALEEEIDVEVELLEGDCDDSIDGNEDKLVDDEAVVVTDTDGESDDSLDWLGRDVTLDETDAVFDGVAIDDTDVVALPDTLTDNVTDADEVTEGVPEGVPDEDSVGEPVPERDEVGLGEPERDAVGVGVPDPVADDDGVGALGVSTS